MRNLAAILLFFSVTARSQEILMPSDVIKMALEKNHDVLIARNQTSIAALQNNAGAAGLSPTISVNASVNNSNLNSYQVFNTGAEQNRKGAISSGVNASLNADWLVFDGLRMFAVKKRLDLNESAGRLQLQQEMENTVSSVLTAYYDMVRVNEMLKAARQNLKLYEERRKIAALRLEIGSDSKVELMMARADENKAQSTIMQLELQMLQSRANLNMMMGRAVDQDFRVADTITAGYNPDYAELKKAASDGNQSLKIARLNESMGLQSVKEARSSVFPYVTVSAAYLFTRTQSQAGFLFSNRQNGLNAGATLRWTIFNGGRNSKLNSEREILYSNQKLFTEQLQLQVDALVFFRFNSLQMNRKILELEIQSLRDAQELQFISLERYRIGKAAMLETIQTQNNLEEVQSRYIQALYNLKIAETELLRVNGSLVK